MIKRTWVKIKRALGFKVCSKCECPSYCTSVQRCVKAKAHSGV